MSGTRPSRPPRLAVIGVLVGAAALGIGWLILAKDGAGDPPTAAGPGTSAAADDDGDGFGGPVLAEVRELGDGSEISSYHQTMRHVVDGLVVHGGAVSLGACSARCESRLGSAWPATCVIWTDADGDRSVVKFLPDIVVDARSWNCHGVEPVDDMSNPGRLVLEWSMQAPSSEVFTLRTSHISGPGGLSLESVDGLPSA